MHTADVPLAAVSYNSWYRLFAPALSPIALHQQSISTLLFVGGTCQCAATWLEHTSKLPFSQSRHAMSQFDKTFYASSHWSRHVIHTFTIARQIIKHSVKVNVNRSRRYSIAPTDIVQRRGLHTNRQSIKCLRGLSPTCLVRGIHCTAEISTRSCPRSASTAERSTLCICLRTAARYAFFVILARNTERFVLWNVAAFRD